MKKILFVFMLAGSVSSFAGFSNWMTPPLPSPPDYIPPSSAMMINLPEDVTKLVEEVLKPSTVEHLIGLKIEIEVTGLDIWATHLDANRIMSQLSAVNDLSYFRDLNTQVELNMNPDGLNYHTPVEGDFYLKREWGYTKEGSQLMTTPIEGRYQWQDPQPPFAVHSVDIIVTVSTYTNWGVLNNKVVSVHSKSRQPLVRGRIKMRRMAGNKGFNYEQSVDIKDGKIAPDSALLLSAGHYEVTLIEPSVCADKAINKNLIITPEMLTDSEPIDMEIVCSYAYDMTMKGSISTNDGSQGMTFDFVLRAEEFLTHDAELDEDEIEEATLSYDEERYPLNTKGERVTLPMRLPMRDKRVYFSSWAENLELESATITDHETGYVGKCELEEGDFGFVRVREDFVYLPGHTSKRGSYPNLDAKFGCMLEDGTGEQFYMQVPLYIGPLGQFAPGGWWNSFNIPLDEDGQEMLLESGENFFQTYTTNRKSAKGDVSFDMTLGFKGYFTKKEHRKPVGGGDDNGGGDGNGNGGGDTLPYIFTDMVSFDNSENEVSIEIMANFSKVKTLDYELFCVSNQGVLKLLKKGILHFTASLPPYGMGRDIIPIKKPKICRSYRVEFDKQDKYPAEAFEPSEIVDFSDEDNGE